MNALKTYISDVKTASSNAKLFVLTNVLFGLLMGATWTGLNLIIENAFSPVVLGTALAMHTLGMAISAVPVGALASKIGYKPILLFGTIAGAICLVLNGMVGSVAILFVLNFIFGLSQGVYEVLPAPFVNATSEKEVRTSVTSVMFGTYWLAVTLVTFCSGYLITFLQSNMGLTEIVAYKYYTYIFAGIGAIGVFAILPMKNVIPSAEVKKKTTVAEYIKAISNKEVIIYLCYMGLIGLGAGLFCPFFANFFKTGLGLDPKTMGNILSIQYFAMVIGIFSCPLLVKKFGRVVTLGATGLLSVPFMLIIANADKFGSSMIPVLTFAFFMRSGLMNLGMPIMYSLILDFVSKEKRATLSGIQTLFMSGMRAVSSIVAGFVMSIPAFTIGNFVLDGYRLPYYVAGVLYAIAIITLLVTYTKKYNREKNVETTELAA